MIKGIDYAKEITTHARKKQEMLQQVYVRHVEAEIDVHLKVVIMGQLEKPTSVLFITSLMASGKYALYMIRSVIWVQLIKQISPSVGISVE